MLEKHSSGEIDMRYLFGKFKNFLKKIVKLFYSIILFFIKYWIVTLVLILIGIAWGYYKDKNTQSVYKSEGIVIPNYGSVDYLYSSIDEVNNRINSSDTVFLKSIMGDNYRALKEIKIEPISDIYNTMTKSREQLEVFRILYQNQDFDKFVENLANSKYFKYHKIEFTVEGAAVSKEIIGDLLEHFNQNPHFQAYQKIYIENAAFQLQEYNKMFVQIDSVLASISKGFTKNETPGVIISDNNNLSLLFQRKQDMLMDVLDANVRFSDYTETVKLVFMNYDIKQSTFPGVIKYPIYLVFLFAFIFFLRFLFLRMKVIAEN